MAAFRMKIAASILVIFASTVFSCGLDTYAILSAVTDYQTPQNSLTNQYTFNYDLSPPEAANMQGFVFFYRIYASTQDLADDVNYVANLNSTTTSGFSVIQALKSKKYAQFQLLDSASALANASTGTSFPSIVYLPVNQSIYKSQIQVTLSFQQSLQNASLPNNLGSYASITDLSSSVPVSYYQLLRPLDRYSSSIDHSGDFFDIQSADADFATNQQATGHYINIYVFAYGIDFSTITEIYSSSTYLSYYDLY
jgi:hypothetical protein